MCTWTRLAIISLESGTPDTDATVARLLRNQTDIGNAIKPYYGNAAGNELTRQLRAHILIAADLVLAAKAGDETKLADAQARWDKNADQIATVLNSVNPRYWPLATMKAEMHMHLKLTTDEAVARLQGKWTDRRRRLRQGASAHPPHVRHAQRRDRQAVSVPLPLTDRTDGVHDLPPPGPGAGLAEDRQMPPLAIGHTTGKMRSTFKPDGSVLTRRMTDALEVRADKGLTPTRYADEGDSESARRRGRRLAAGSARGLGFSFDARGNDCM